MNAQEMGYEWRITYESIASADAPGYTPREISIFLTESQEDIVKEVCQRGIDKDDISRRILGNLRTYASLEGRGTFNLILLPVRGYTVELPDNFFYPHIETIKFNGDIINVKPEPFEAVRNLKNPFRKPSSIKYWRLFYNSNILIIPPETVDLDSDQDAKMNLVYIRKPNPIIIENLGDDTIDGISVQTNCELDDIIHRDIVYRAAKKAFAATKDQTGYQIQNIEENS